MQIAMGVNTMNCYQRMNCTNARRVRRISPSPKLDNRMLYSNCTIGPLGALDPFDPAGTKITLVLGVLAKFTIVSRYRICIAAGLLSMSAALRINLAESTVS